MLIGAGIDRACGLVMVPWKSSTRRPGGAVNRGTNEEVTPYRDLLLYPAADGLPLLSNILGKGVLKGRLKAHIGDLV